MSRGEDVIDIAESRNWQTHKDFRPIQFQAFVYSKPSLLVNNTFIIYFTYYMFMQFTNC